MSKFAGMGLAVDRPTRMTITHPITRQPLEFVDENGKGTGKFAWIDVLSGQSSAAKAHDLRVRNRRLQRRAPMTAEEMAADDTELLVVLTTGWGLATLDGVPVDTPCTPENARELYTEPVMTWLRNQVDTHAGAEGNLQPTALSTS